MLLIRHDPDLVGKHLIDALFSLNVNPLRLAAFQQLAGKFAADKILLRIEPGQQRFRFLHAVLQSGNSLPQRRQRFFHLRQIAQILIFLQAFLLPGRRSGRILQRLLYRRQAAHQILIIHFVFPFHRVLFPNGSIT